LHSQIGHTVCSWQYNLTFETVRGSLYRWRRGRSSQNNLRLFEFVGSTDYFSSLLVIATTRVRKHYALNRLLLQVTEFYFYKLMPLPTLLSLSLQGLWSWRRYQEQSHVHPYSMYYMAECHAYGQRLGTCYKSLVSRLDLFH
jgi:hypothetical protein